MATRTKEQSIIYQSSLKASLEFLKLNGKSAISIQDVLNLTYVFSEFCENDTKGDENFKKIVLTLDSQFKK